MLYGRTCYSDKVIFINEASDNLKKEETLLHELAHAFISETQIISQEQNFAFTEEMVCEFIGKYFNDISKVLLKIKSSG